MNPSACSPQITNQVDRKLSKLVTYLESRIPYYKIKHGKFQRNVKLIPLKNHYVEIVEYFLVLRVGHGDITDQSIILNTDTEIIEKADPEFAQKLFDELVRVFEVPALDLVNEVFN